MKIEKLSDTQIRCTLNGSDMTSRNLSLSELTYGSEKARSLFREMMQQAYNDFGFEAEDAPLMIEAIPLSSDSIMLLITRMEDPEELDTRFSTFSPAPEDDSITELTNELLDGAENLAQFFQAALSAGGIEHAPVQEKEKPAPEEENSRASSIRIFRFSSLDLVSEAAQAAGDAYDGTNTLYKDPKDGQYYLVLSAAGADPMAFSRTSNILCEYGSKQKYEYASEAFFTEHFEVICKDNALQVFREL